MDRKRALELVSNAGQDVYAAAPPPLKQPRLEPIRDDEKTMEDLLDPAFGYRWAESGDNFWVLTGTDHTVKWEMWGRDDTLVRTIQDRDGKLDSLNDLPARETYEWAPGNLLGWVAMDSEWFRHGRPGRRGNRPDKRTHILSEHALSFSWSDPSPIEKMHPSKIMTPVFARKYLGVDLRAPPYGVTALKFPAKNHIFYYQPSDSIAANIEIGSYLPGNSQRDSVEGAPAEVLFKDDEWVDKGWYRNDLLHRNPIEGPAWIERYANAPPQESFFVNNNQLTPDQVREIKERPFTHLGVSRRGI